MLTVIGGLALAIPFGVMYYAFAMIVRRIVWREALKESFGGFLGFFITTMAWSMYDIWGALIALLVIWVVVFSVRRGV